MIRPDEVDVEERRNAFGEIRRVQTLMLDNPGPQAFLAEMPEQNTVHPHFHDADQFQIFLGTPGATYQRTDIVPGSWVIHYSDAYTTYGPFATTSHPLGYFTLRAQHSTLTAYMPQDRDKLVRRGRRNIHFAIVAGERPDVRPGRSSIEALMSNDADTAAVFHLKCGPGTTIATPDASDSGGQYCIVVAGAATVQQREHGERSIAWITPDDEPLVLEAGADVGVEVVVLQFARQ